MTAKDINVRSSGRFASSRLRYEGASLAGISAADASDLLFFIKPL